MTGAKPKKLKTIQNQDPEYSETLSPSLRKPGESIRILVASQDNQEDDLAPVAENENSISPNTSTQLFRPLNWDGRNANLIGIMGICCIGVVILIIMLLHISLLSQLPVKVDTMEMFFAFIRTSEMLCSIAASLVLLRKPGIFRAIADARDALPCFD